MASSIIYRFHLIRVYRVYLFIGVPAEENEIARVARRMGFIREIGCGQTFHIGRPSERHSGNMETTNNLNSKAYREWSPGIQLLHCIRNDRPTLSSDLDCMAKHEFIDGFAAAQWLRYQEPNAFTVLTHTPVTFSFLDVERDVSSNSTALFHFLIAIKNVVQTALLRLTSTYSPDRSVYWIKDFTYVCPCYCFA